MRLSVVLPVLDEAALIHDALADLQPLRATGHELIVVDGGSHDATVQLSQQLADQVLTAARGRAAQMNAGAEHASEDVLLFLHADTRLPPNAWQQIEQSILAGALWGRFDVSLSGNGILLRMVEFFMNKRSRFTGIATGDQGIFVRRDIFNKAGAYPEIPLMEDVALSHRLHRLAKPHCLSARMQVSARRWQQHGVLLTVLLMWRLRLAYFFGVNPAHLAKQYYGEHP